MSYVFVRENKQTTQQAIGDKLDTLSKRAHNLPFRPGNGVKIYKSESDSKNSDSNDLNHELLRNTQPIFTSGNNNALDARWLTKNWIDFDFLFSHHSYNQAVNYDDKYHEPYDYGQQRNDYGQQRNDYNQPRTYHSSSTIPNEIPNEINNAVNRPRPPPPQPPSQQASYQYNNYHSNLNNQMVSLKASFLRWQAKAHLTSR